MTEPTRHRPAAGLAAVLASLDERLENEAEVLDAFLLALSRNQLPPEAWSKLASAAQRDDRITELAFAFEGLAADRKIRTLQAGVVAEFMFQSSVFFGDVMGDDVGAVSYLDKAMAALPTHAGSIARFEEYLTKKSEFAKLGEFFFELAQHRSRAEQPVLLRKATAAFERAGAGERVADALQQLLRLDPKDDEARVKLEGALLSANRPRDVARMLEQALATDPPPPDELSFEHRTKLLALYDETKEVERSLPHVEWLLARAPGHEGARSLGLRLLEMKPTAQRAASALAGAAEKQGNYDEAMRFYTIELEHARGPRRFAALRALAAIKHDRTDDMQGAYEAAEAALLLEPTDTELLERFAALTRALGKHEGAIKTLQRLVSLAKDPSARARLAAEMGELLLATTDVKRARAAFSSALTVPGADDAAVLPAAHALARLYSEDEDWASLGEMLERIVRTETDLVRKQQAAEQLAELAQGPLGDPTRAVAAFRGLLDTPSRKRALDALEPLLSSMGDAVGMAEVLRAKAQDEPDKGKKRALLERGAEALTESSGNLPAASAAWREIVEQFGPSRESLARWVPLLELERDFPTLAKALEALAALVRGKDKVGTLARLGLLRMQWLGDPQGAVEAFRDALSMDTEDSISRESLEQLLQSNEPAVALAAGTVLEPIFRAEGARAGLLRILLARAQSSPEAGARAQALSDAVALAEHLPGEHPRVLSLVRNALGQALAEGAPVEPWMAALERLSPGDQGAATRADVLSLVLGDGPVTSDALLAVARALGDAAMAVGDRQRALEAYRRALEFSPSSPELMAGVDLLLREQGTPHDRVRLYRAALGRETQPEKRRGLHLAIANLQRKDLADSGGAMETLRAALAEGPDDAMEEALFELYSETGAFADACGLLEQRLSRTAPGAEERLLRSRIARLASDHGLRDRAVVHAKALAEDAFVTNADLDLIEQVADRAEDNGLLAMAAARRVELSESTEDKTFWLTRLGTLQNERGETAAAAAAWRDAAALAEQAGDSKTARKLYERVRRSTPYDRTATERLAALVETSGDWGSLPELYAALVDSAGNPEERQAALLKLAEVLATRAEDLPGAFDAAARAFLEVPSDAPTLVKLAEYALAANQQDALFKTLNAVLNDDAGRDPTLRPRLLAAKAEVLAADEARAGEARPLLRSVLDDPFADADTKERAAARFEGLLSRCEPEAEAEAWRWLLGWRASREQGTARAAVLRRFARLEEEKLHDPTRALDLWRQAVEADPADAEAASDLARAMIASGDVDGALGMLRARVASAEPEAASRLRAEIAGLLADVAGREGEAMAELRTILEKKPDDAAALRLLVKLLAHREIGAEASKLLEASLANAGSQGRKRVLGALVTGALDAPPERRKAWHQGLLDVAESQDEAYGVLLRALAELPGEIEWWDRAEQLARRLDRPQELSDAYHAVLSRPLPTEEVIELGQRAVAFHEEWFDDASAVIRILDRLVDVDPGGWAFDRLKLLYDSQERWEDLFALYDRVLARDIDQTRRTDLLEDAAQIAKDFAKNADRAINYLEQLLNFKPKNERLLASLERLYERYGKHRELISLLGAQLGGKSLEEAQALRRRMATLWLDELNDAGSALLVVEEMMSEGDTGEGSIELLEKVLAAAPVGEEVKKTLPPTSSPVSERVAAAHETLPPPRASVPPRGSVAPGRASSPPKGGRKRVLVRQRTASLLRERYAAANREADLARVLEVELEAVKNAKERIRRHAEVAALHEKLGNEAAALEHATALVMLDPDATSHRERLTRLADKTGRFDRLAEVLAAAADDCEGEELRATLLLDAAATYADRLGDGARAIDLLGRVLGLDAGPATQLLAARRLDALLASSDRKAERLTVLERLAALEDADARKTALATAARLATEIGEIDRCVAAWEARLQDDESDREALDGLVEVLGAHARLAPLVNALLARAKVLEDPVASRADRVRAATLLSTELDAPEAAVDVWEAIRAESGEADDVDAALADLYERRERWDGLADLLDRTAKRQPDAAAKAETLARLGDVQRTRLGVPSVAVDSYERALEARPGHEGALSGLGALLSDAEAGRAALAALLRDHQQQEAWAKIVALLPDRLRLAADDTARVEILLETAGLFEQRAGDLEAAFHSAREAFVLAGGEERVRVEAARLAEAVASAGVADAWRALADAHRAVIEALDGKGETARSLALRMHLGAMLEERLDDPRGALVQYTRVAADDPTSQGAALALVRVAARIARWDAAAKVVLDRAELAGLPDEELLHAVEEAAAAHAGWDGLTPAFEAALGQRSGLSREAARDLEARLAAWHRDRRADAEAAEAAYTRALAHDPNDTALLSQLAALQRRHSGRPLIDSLLRLSQATGGDPELLREAAEVASRVVVDRGLAKSILERLLKLASARWVGSEEHPPSTVTPGVDRRSSPPMTDVEAAPSVGNPLHPSEHVEWSLAELLRVHNEEGNAERIVELLEQASKLPFPRARVRELLHLAAQTALDRLGDGKVAQGFYEQLFNEDPRDELAAAKLAEVYASLSLKDELLRLRRIQVDVATEPAVRVAHRLEAALLERDAGRVDEAVAVLRENLGDVPRHPRTTLVLSETLEAAGRWSELAAFAAEQAALAEADHDTLSAVELWSRAAAIAEERLGDLSAALAHYKRSLALELRAPLLDAVARIHEQREEHEQAAEHLDRLAREFPERRAAIIVRLADAFARASRDADAQTRLEAALQDPASPPEVAARLGEIYRRTEQFAPLAELVARQAGLATTDDARRTSLIEAAEIFLSKCAKAERAVPLLEQAAALAPDDRPLRLRLAEALQEAGRKDDARALLRDMIDGFAGRRPKERAQVHFHLARLHLRSGERANALAELEAATRIDPANPEILRMVAELARDDGQLDKAERSYRALLAVLRRADEDAPVLRTEVLVELSALAERHGEAERATEILESAFETAAGSDAEAKRLEKALRAKGNTTALLRALEARLERAGQNAAARADALAELARTHESLGNLAAALRTQLEVLALSPASAPAHEQAAGLAARAGNPDAYVDTTVDLADKAAKAGDVRLSTQLSLRAAEALMRSPDGASRAAPILARAEAVAPTQPDVLRALDRVYGALGEEEKQEAVLAKLGANEMENTARDPQKAADILFRLAALRAKREATLPEAARSLSAAFELSKDAERTLAIVQDVLARLTPTVELLDLLGRAAKAAERTDLAQQALRLRAERPDAPVAILREAAAAALETGDLAAAEVSLRRIVDATSTERDVARWAVLELAALLRRRGQLDEGLTLELRAARISEPAEARKLREDVASNAKQAGLPALELMARREIADSDPSDVPARAALLEALRAAGNAAALLETIDAFLPAVTDEAERRELRRERAGVLATQPDQADEAIAELRALLQEDPYDTRAVAVLSELLEARGETSELGALLERQLDAAKDRQDGAAVALVTLRLGALAEASDPERARELYVSGLDWEPKNRQLLLAMLRLLKDAEPADRADVMEKLLETEQGPAAEKLALDLASLRAEQWDDAGAERALEAGFRAHPASEVLRERLSASYDERGDRAKLASLKETASRALSGHAAKMELLEAARLYQGLNDSEGASRVLHAAHAMNPEDGEVLRMLVAALAQRADEAAAAELEQLASRASGEAFVTIAATRSRVLGALGRHDEAVADAERVYEIDRAQGRDVLAAALATAAEGVQPESQRPLRQRAAALCVEAGRLDEAHAQLEALLAANDADRETLWAMARIEESGGHFDMASDTYLRLVDLEEGEQLVAAALQLAEAAAKANNPGYARAGLEKARAAAPADARVLEKLAAVYEAIGATAELAELRLAEARATADPAKRFEMLVRAGSTLLEPDPAAAAAALEEARAIKPADMECTGLLADAFIALGRHDDARDVLQGAVTGAKNRRSRELGHVYLRLGRLEVALGNKAGAMQMLGTALDMDGQNGVIASELAHVALEEGNLDVATRALRVITMLRVPAPIPKAIAYERLGEIAMHQGDTKRAVMLLKRAIDEDHSLERARELLAELGNG